MRFRTKKSKSLGFTLIELLIVIIIIGILAAIAFVAYTGSQNKAKKAGAETTVAQIRSKLAEYNSDQGNYPVDQATLNTWLASSSGGNNASLSTKFTSGNGYTYAANDGAGGACDNSATQCSGYSVTADASIFSGSADITATN